MKGVTTMDLKKLASYPRFSISGHIDENTYFDFKNWLGQFTIENQPEALVIDFDSGGGSTWSGFDIYNLICGRRAIGDTHIIGFVARECSSMALSAFLACDLRVALCDARFTIHQVTFKKEIELNANQASDIGGALHLPEGLAQDLKRDDDRNIEILSTRTGMSKDKARELVDKGGTIRAVTALELGIVHEVITL